MILHAIALALLLTPAIPRMPRSTPRRAAIPPFNASLSLTLRTKGGEVRITQRPGKPVPAERPTVTLKAGEKPQIRWQVRNIDPAKAIRNVVVHFLVRREVKAGEAIPASPSQGSLVDTVMGTDISVRNGISGSANTAVWEPGTYLVELELLDEEGQRRNFSVAEMTVTP